MTSPKDMAEKLASAGGPDDEKCFVAARGLRYKVSVTAHATAMKILQTLTLVLLLILLALAWAAWDMQRREAAAPVVDETVLRQALGIPLPAAICPICGGKNWIETLGAPEKCPACNGTGTLHTLKGSEVCIFCNGTGKIAKKIKHPCPACSGGAAQKSPEIPADVPRLKPVEPAGKATTLPLVASPAKMILCPTCNGSKMMWTTEVCRNCKGTGTYKNRAAWSQGITCPFCKGTGKISRETDKPCPTCKGVGMISQPATAPTTN